MARSVENDSSTLTVSDLFPIQQSPPYFDQKLYAFRNHNIHETALAVGSSQPNDTSDVPTAAAFDLWDGTSHGMLQHHVEMLVVILKDDVAWKHLQRSTHSCSSMQIRHSLDDILRASFRVAVERREKKDRNKFLRSDVVIESYGSEEEEGLKFSRAAPFSVDDDCSDGAGTLETESTSGSYDDDEYCNGTVWAHDPEEDNDVEEEDGEFLMGGRRGQGMLLEPISYKEVDLMRHPRSQILGDAQSTCGAANRHHNPPELPAVFLSSRRRSSLSRICPSSPAPLAIAPNRIPLVERV
jgi:hypothetical protein